MRQQHVADAPRERRLERSGRKFRGTKLHEGIGQPTKFRADNHKAMQIGRDDLSYPHLTEFQMNCGISGERPGTYNRPFHRGLCSVHSWGPKSNQEVRMQKEWDGEK